MDVSVKLLEANGNSGEELAALSLAQLQGAEGQYSMAQSPDEHEQRELNLRHWTSFPLSVAFTVGAHSILTSRQHNKALEVV